MEYKDIQKVNETLSTTDIKGKDYVEVNERVKAFRMLYPEGQIVTNIYSLESGVVVIQACVSDNEGKLLATGTSYEVENSTFINKTSYIENCETSAVGRALGFLGIGIDTSIASKDEIETVIEKQNHEIDKQSKNEFQVTNGKITKAQISTLTKILTDERKPKLLAYFKVEKIEDLTEEQFGKAVEILKKEVK